ncbi:hypothetical protein [Polymorphospora sp. NPDC050346]|uniref:hypothetical protein n=1 Tax=Polymorphospora sp. NPDC050346 TaxID=3155780 RepID=UPI0033DE7BA3
MKCIRLHAWRGSHYIGAAELLTTLGRITAELSWELQIDEVAPGPAGARIEALVRQSRVCTSELILAAFLDGQIIDGELRGYVDDADEPYIVLRAVDSTDWDIECVDPAVYFAVKTALVNSVDTSSFVGQDRYKAGPTEIAPYA